MSTLTHGAAKPDANTVRQIAQRLASGEVVLIPTETVYGLAATPKGLPALRDIRTRLGKPADAPCAWHAPDVDAVMDALRPASAVHRRIMQRLWPGPVTVSIELGAGLAAARERVGAPAGMFDDGRRLLVRVPDHDWARAIAKACPGPMGAEGVPTSGGPARTCPEAVEALRAAGVQLGGVVDLGPSRHGRSSTLIELGEGGPWRVAPGGVYDEPYVRRRIQRTVLFVCTGNTCRSPMAEALAAHEVRRADGGVPTVVKSAGLAGGGGAATTPEALDALRALGVTVTPSRSKSLTPAMIDEADVIFTMTRAHQAGVTDLAPSAAGKVRLLSPRGEDIPDPIGGPASLYEDLARQMQEMIRRRLREMDP